MINQNIFKSYDVRGIYPSELNEDAAFLVGSAFARHTKAKKTIIGYDARLSSPALLENLAKGLASQGVVVTTVGKTPTEMSYFSIASYDFDTSIMITASHNPKEYNGFKMMQKNGNDIAMVRGKDLLALIDESELAKKPSQVTIQEKDILQDYKAYMLNLFNVGNLKKMKVVVDASNGVIGKLINLLEDSLPLEITKINFEPDGNFPNHSPNPLEAGSINQIAKAIKEQNADVGFIFDADADRVFLIDENGKMVPADMTLLLLAKYFLDKKPEAIAYNAVCSKAVREFISQWGGMPVRTPVGFVNVRDGLLKNNGAMGGEVSGHYCFRDYFFMDSGIMAFLILLEIISGQDKKVSELAKELLIYTKLETNFKISDKDAVLKKLQGAYQDGAQDFLDGTTVEYQDWWFNARPSNTEPLLRLTIEANSPELLAEKKLAIEKIINQS